MFRSLYPLLRSLAATESGKSIGQFLTPAEVSRILSQFVGTRRAKTRNETTVADFTCGSGSLLLKVGDEASHDKDVKVTLYGQERDSAAAGLPRMNVILQDQLTALIVLGNTLTDPKNDLNLNLLRYIDSTEPEDIQDINGHLRGGIPERDIDALECYWQVFPGMRCVVRTITTQRLKLSQSLNWLTHKVGNLDQNLHSPEFFTPPKSNSIC